MMTYYFIPFIVYPDLNIKGKISFDDFQGLFKKNSFKITPNRLMFQSNLVIENDVVTKNRYIAPHEGTFIDANIREMLIKKHVGFVVYKETATKIDFTKNMKTSQDKIDTIMDNFNFTRVEQAMRATKWIWGGAEEPDGIPTEPELRKCARRLLVDVSKKNVSEEDFRWSISTGGFKASKYHDGELELEFIMESWETSS